MIFQMSELKKLKVKDFEAFSNLVSHLNQGAKYKKILILSLINLGNIKLLQRLPVLSGLIQNAKRLVVGHIANARLTIGKDAVPLSPPGLFTSKELPDSYGVDVLVIGSGPGAASAAVRELEIGTKSIAVIERGHLPRTSHELHHTLTHVTRDFHQAGQELIFASGLPLFTQANVFGGGSEINSGLFHKLPQKYLEKFSDAFGVENKVWLEHEQRIYTDLNPIEMNVSGDSSLLARGSKDIGLIVSNIPRWRTYSKSGEFEHRGMNSIYWGQLALNPDINLFSCVEAVNINVKSDEYVSVLVREVETGKLKTIKTKRVHLAGGPISTPALLAKSRLIKWRDTRFSWHPMIRVVASTKHTDLGLGDIDPFQSWTSDRRLKFGSAVSTAPLLAIALGREVNDEEIHSLRSYYVTYSSSGRGGILPILKMPWYRFSKSDRQNSREGIAMLKEIVESGGGKLINEQEISANKHSTVHIFGTLPITSRVFIPGTNQLTKDSRVRVSDGSILPFGPGVNPQGVIMTAVSAINRDLKIV